MAFGIYIALTSQSTQWKPLSEAVLMNINREKIRKTSLLYNKWQVSMKNCITFYSLSKLMLCMAGIPIKNTLACQDIALNIYKYDFYLSTEKWQAVTKERERDVCLKLVCTTSRINNLSESEYLSGDMSTGIHSPWVIIIASLLNEFLPLKNECSLLHHRCTILILGLDRKVFL